MDKWGALQEWVDNPARTPEEILAVAKAEAGAKQRAYVLAKLYRAWHKRIKSPGANDLDFLMEWARGYEGEPDYTFSSSNRGKLSGGAKHD